MNSMNRWRAPSGSRRRRLRVVVGFPTSIETLLNPPRLPSAAVFLTLAVLLFPTEFAGSSPSSSPAGGDTDQRVLFEPGSVETQPTIRLKRRFKLAAAPGEIRYLLANLDITCAVIRSWELEEFRARRIEPDRYRARDGAGMSGLLQVRTLTDSGALVLGSGRYRTAALGWTLRGRAVARIRIEATPPRTTTVVARVRARVDNPVVHWVGRIIDPILRTLARHKADHFIGVARRTLRTIHQHPGAVKDRLEQMDQDYVNRWKQYPHPGTE